MQKLESLVMALLSCCNTEILQLVFFFSFPTPFSYGFCEPRKIASTLNQKIYLKKNPRSRKGDDRKTLEETSIDHTRIEKILDQDDVATKRPANFPRRSSLPALPPPPPKKAALVRVLSRSSGYQMGVCGVDKFQPFFQLSSVQFYTVVCVYILK